jgi:superfamily II DNA helicase RecQ
MTGPQKNGAANVVAAEPRALTAEGEALAGRIREWRAAEAKRLKVPAYVVLHDRTLTALAGARPRNPRELLNIDGMGPAKVERFGEELLRLCADK